jgi:hypothetical protein
LYIFFIQQYHDISFTSGTVRRDQGLPGIEAWITSPKVLALGDFIHPTTSRAWYEEACGTLKRIIYEFPDKRISNPGVLECELYFVVVDATYQARRYS